MGWKVSAAEKKKERKERKWGILGCNSVSRSVIYVEKRLLVG
jgi:hypothetical protein